MHKLAQVELQLDRPQLPYSETLWPTIAGGSPACYHRRQPNPIRKGPHNGEPKIGCKSEGWNMLWLLRSKLKLPWCCLCDFNELLQVQNKQGGPPQAHNHIQAF